MNSDALSRYATRQQSDINLVCMYLQIITLSDMSLKDGKSACSHNLQGTRRPNQRLRHQAWPGQDLPSALQLRLWYKYISTNFLRYSNKWIEVLGSPIPKAIPLTDNVLHHSTLQQHIKSLPLWHSHLLLIINKCRQI